MFPHKQVNINNLCS